MSEANKNDHMTKCLVLLEEKMGRGDSATWSNYDYEKVGESIFEKTNVRLSTTTLKRIWGRIKYKNAPTTSTLNTLAQYLDYKDWREFMQDRENRPKETPAPFNNESSVVDVRPLSRKKGKHIVNWKVLFLIAIPALFYLVYQWISNEWFIMVVIFDVSGWRKVSLLPGQFCQVCLAWWESELEQASQISFPAVKGHFLYPSNGF